MVTASEERLLVCVCVEWYDVIGQNTRCLIAQQMHSKKSAESLEGLRPLVRSKLRYNLEVEAVIAVAFLDKC